MDTVFIASQPRAGSTLLQRILGAHPDIHIEAEPWILLRLLYPLNHSDLSAGYDETIARDAIKDFIQALPGGERSYQRAARAMAESMYKEACNASGRSVFVDKTPRYHYILPEIRATFPESSLLLVYRNPLAVLASVVDTFTGLDAEFAAQFNDDLLEAPRRLVDAAVINHPRTMIVHYEKLVVKPEETVRQVCDHLGLSFVDSMLEYGRKAAPAGRAGDPVGVHRRSRPDASGLDGWQNRLADPRAWGWFDEYLKLLDATVVARMGYDHAELSEIVASRRPKRPARGRTPFSYGRGEGLTRLSMFRRLRRSVATRGLKGTLNAVLRR